MAKNYWMVVMTPENFEITKERGFDLYGMRRRHRRRAQRMEPDDVILIYVNGIRKWTAITQVIVAILRERRAGLEGRGDR